MTELKIKTRNFEGDAPGIEGYDLLKTYAKTIKGVEGITCEIGLRRSLGSVSIMQGLIENWIPSHKRFYRKIDFLYFDLLIKSNTYTL